ncbi:MAG: PAS domain S-box protein [Candidatus Omnitrophica bacterium]|nr:PAS domain S-box protein [Candidatus Omnitrophota bacterium]
MNHFYNFFLFFTLISTFVLGVFVFVKNPRHLFHRVFLGMCLSLVTFMSTFVTRYSRISFFAVETGGEAMWWVQLAQYSVYAGLTLYLYFAMVFPDGEQQRLSRRVKWLFFFLFPAIMVIFINAQLTVKGVTFVDGCYYIVPGPCFFLSAAYSLLYFGAVIRITLKKGKTLRGRKKIQHKYFFIGSVTMVSFMLVTNLAMPVATIFFPALHILKKINIIGPVGILFFLFATSYAIIKYKLMAITPEMVSKHILNLTPTFLVLGDGDGRVFNVNHAVSAILGYRVEELRGKRIERIIHEKDKARVMAMINRKEQVQNAEVSFVSGLDQEIPVLFSLAYIASRTMKDMGLICLAQDISELKETQDRLTVSCRELRTAQAKLIRSEKMASIGHLSSGLAEEIQKPLDNLKYCFSDMKHTLKLIPQSLDTYAQDFISSFPLYPQKADELLQYVKQVREDAHLDYLKKDVNDIIRESIQGVHRVDKILYNLKNFSRPDEGRKEFVNLNDIIEQTLAFIDNELKYSCRIVKKLGDIPDIEINRHQWGQVFVNLLLNAKNAIEKDGLIRVESSFVDHTVIVTVYDNGRGIPPEDISKVFNPFFTTGRVGSGTGLGLSIVYGIVERHRGTIDVKSPPQKGTTLTIKIPV